MATLGEGVSGMGDRRSRNCNQLVVYGVCCQRFDSEIVGRVLNPLSRGFSRKVYRLVSVTSSNQPHLIG